MKLRFGLAPVFTGATYLVQAEAAEKRQKQGYHTVNTSTAVQHCRRTMYEIQVLVLVLGTAVCHKSQGVPGTMGVRLDRFGTAYPTI